MERGLPSSGLEMARMSRENPGKHLVDRLASVVDELLGFQQLSSRECESTMPPGSSKEKTLCAAGWRGEWTIYETTRKLYILHNDAA